MAATANVKRNVFGSLKVTYGDFSATAGDAPLTINVEGGKVYLANFETQDGTGVPQTIGDYAISTSGTAGVVTVTVYQQGTITAGQFIIIHS